MPFLRKVEEAKNETAHALLEALDAHHPLSFAHYRQELEAGTHPAQIGAEIGRLLAERETQCQRTAQDRDEWRERAENYLQIWEKNTLSEDLKEARQQIERLERELSHEKEASKNSGNYAKYLAQEKARLEALLQEQNTIIAKQQIQLAEWDES